ncbi:hypothetical protein [Algoriphagus persicinus]|uniref:hypothetical protein n=1 Tax=Algoriphagus persicinus TaxID=3108754 RepID=UPI002B3A0C5B|nr:hypothetical protein [Algoriphagus sp. E1-3-M2]MEB2785511.1 hypothetical protein [Algoriphagus sp. E1-3-M2]
MITVNKSPFSLESFLNRQQKAKALALQSEITRINGEIDQLLYELYGLTEEEIKIVVGGEG